jgi:hypothetical protein
MQRLRRDERCHTLFSLIRAPTVTRIQSRISIFTIKEPIPLDLPLTGPQSRSFESSSVMDGAIAEDIFSQ